VSGVAAKPKTEGFFWYKHPLCDARVVQTEYRPDRGELYAFVIGFDGGTPVRLMDGEWSEELTFPASP